MYLALSLEPNVHKQYVALTLSFILSDGMITSQYITTPTLFTFRHLCVIKEDRKRKKDYNNILFPLRTAAASV